MALRWLTPSLARCSTPCSTPSLTSSFKVSLQLAVAGWVSLLAFPGPSVASPAPASPASACPAAVQSQANHALADLDQRQQQEDAQLRSHPTATYATMNGPVLRELEKRQQREALETSLERQASQRHHCKLVLP